MSTANHPTRRNAMASLASLSLPGAATAAAARDDDVRVTHRSTLVAVFSRSGNTRVVAGLIQRAFGAEVFEIRPAVAYPDEYLATVEQAKQERDGEVHPPLADRLSSIATYDTVFLGFPIWGETVPPVVKSFLSGHDLSGKTVVPFITHGGYGLGDSQSVLKRLAPKARLGRAFAMQADQERHTMDRVKEWLHGNADTRQP